MDDEIGGQNSEQKQRQTASAIARRKVMEAYSADTRNFEDPGDKPQIDAEEWKKYHSAWQDYYQKYYGDYYSQAARDYVEQAKLKYERARAESKVTTVETQLEEKEILREAEAKGIREKIRQHASDRAKRVRRSKHFVPLVIGAIVIVFGVLLQYNQVIFANVAAYMTPGGGAVEGISAIDPNVSAEVGPEPLLLIPKLNIVVPVVYGAANDRASMDKAMGNGVAQFSVPGASAMPGEVGNLAISGHSAGNVYQVSDYKFVFSGLERLVAGDLIYVNYNSKRYTYSVVGKQTVEPTNVAALTTPVAKPMLTLITCTPLGTSRYRLLVSAEQISPDPDGAAEMTPVEGATPEMPANDPSPLEQVWGFLTGSN